MTLDRNRTRPALIALALVSAFSHQAAAQLPAAPQVVLESNPTPQQEPQQPVPSPSFAAPTVTIQSNPSAAPAAVAPAPAAAPSFSSPTVTIQSNPGVAPAAPAAAAAPIPTPVPAPIPAARTAVAPLSPPPGQPVSTPTPDGIGTTIFGEQEAPIGLYITPWKDDYAERGLDRPARLLDEAMEPIDPATFRRQIEYYETITEFRRKQRGEAK